ncbi:MAG: DNA-processing protein DprA [Candidatus Magasanikbacteria bacterium]
MKKIRRLQLKSDDYPKLLKEIKNPPGHLYFVGNVPEPGEFMVAIVGTREAGSYGVAQAKRIAKKLSEKGITVVSGLALGIDGSAHRGALSGKARTFGVLANGLDRIYPNSHRPLAKDIIADGGGLLSEYSKGTPPYPENFLERNRIVSGLCKALIVIEAPSRSGSLNSARHALEQNREVFVVPGRINNENYVGSHRLIRSGARLVRGAEDIIEDLRIPN